MISRLHAIVRGRVQGVGFRYFVADEARELKLCGTVRNLMDGNVEVVAEGERAVLEALLARCREGPPMSMVRDVDVTWEEATGKLDGFRVTH